jgi:type VI secretion system secreted protein VgrG
MNLYTLRSAAIPKTAFVCAFVGREALHTPYSFDIGFTLDHGVHVDVAAAVGSRATLVFDRGTDPPFEFHGVLGSVEMAHAHGEFTLYQARLVPKLWTLTLNHHSRIFTDVTIPQIIEAVLKKSGLTAKDYRLRLFAKYIKHEHICQYRESYFDFLSRLMEREGIYYYFEHKGDREVMVITDSRDQHEALRPGAMRYFPSDESDTTRDEALRRFRAKSNLVPKTVELRDYSYDKPQLDLTSRANVAMSSGGDMVMWGEHYLSPDEGTRYAGVRAEELAAQRELFFGEGFQPYLRSGYRFTLDQHPITALNREYLATEVEHVGKDGSRDFLGMLFGRQQKDAYTASVTAIPAATQYRAPRRTRWPRIDSVTDGIVDGAATSDYAQIDEHGRYKVRILFDEGDIVDGSNSTWVRMLQPHGGSPEGFHMPLHKETEVMIVFLGGHPDRPAIVGAAHNAQKPSTVNVQNRSQHVIRTRAGNHFVLEDMRGSEYIHLDSPAQHSYLHLGIAGHGSAHNFDLNTEAKGRIHTHDSLEVYVDNWLFEKVGDSVTEEYVGPVLTTVKKNVEQHYQSKLGLYVTDAVTIVYNDALTFDVMKQAHEAYHDTYNLDITGASDEEWKDTRDVTVHGHLTETFKDGHTLTITKGESIDVSDGQEITVKGGLKHKVTGGYELNVDHLEITASDYVRIHDPNQSVFNWTHIAFSAFKTDVVGLSLVARALHAEAIGLSAKFALFEAKNTPMKFDLFTTWLGCVAIDLHMGFLIRS